MTGPYKAQQVQPPPPDFPLQFRDEGAALQFIVIVLLILLVLWWWHDWQSITLKRGRKDWE